MRIMPCLCLSLLLSSLPLNVSAESGDAETELNAAWNAYQKAVAAGSVELRLDAAREALAAGREALPASDPRFPRLLVNLGNAFLDANEGEGAYEAFREALELCKRIHGTRAAELIDPLEGLARAEGLLGKGYQQRKYFRRALGIAADHFGPRSLEYAGLATTAVVESYEDSGWIYGQPLLLRAREIYVEHLGATSAEVGVIDFQLGRLLFVRGSHHKALQRLEDALALLNGEETQVATHRHGVHTLLVTIYDEHGNDDKVVEHLLAISALNRQRGIAELEPVLVFTPESLWRVAVARATGHVDLRFTVDPRGKLVDIEVADVVADPVGAGSIIRRSALRTVRHFRYAPTTVDGEPVATEGVRLRVSFSDDGRYSVGYRAL